MRDQTLWLQRAGFKWGQARGRGSFWRTQAEALALSVLAYVLTLVLAGIAGPPWAELVSVASIGCYIWAAWRLAPGQGSWPRRAARLLGWALLAALAGGLVGWALFVVVPHPRPLLGVDASAIAITPATAVLSSLLVVMPLFGVARVLLRLRDAARTRLRWQLSLSYLLVSALVTLVVYLVVGLYLGVSSLSIEPALLEPALAAERAAATLEPLVQAGVTPETLRAVMAGLLDGSVRVPVPAGSAVSDAGTQPALSGVRRVAVLEYHDTLKAVIAAVPDEPAPAMLDALAPVLAQARAGGCVSGRPAAGTLPDTAVCPLRNQRGQVDALVVVETIYAEPGAQFGAALGRVIALTTTVLAAAVTSLLLASVVVLLAASALGYLLARRVTRRVEQLAQATEALAAGNLDRRIAVERADELGRLAGDFNLMAARLAEREQALLVERQRALQLLEGNRRLVANISHELRTPLATLRGYLEALEASHGAQLPAHDMRVIHGETQRLTGLIEDLFTLARAEEQRLPLTIEAVDVIALVRGLVDTYAPLARREREIEVLAVLPASLPPVAADRMRLEQVLHNLVQNALRHTPPGGIVAFEATASDTDVTIVVADTGVGIAPEELNLIFERFYRGDASRARETGGAGLGLALVRELVAAMGGRVHASSSPGHGSRFGIILPLY
jgi:signal transduction histidine kinase